MTSEEQVICRLREKYGLDIDEYSDSEVLGLARSTVVGASLNLQVQVDNFINALKSTPIFKVIFGKLKGRSNDQEI